MSTCKECIHEIVCDALIKTGLPWADGEYPAEVFCMAFKGKNDLVEVVRCKDCKFFMEYATLHKAAVEKGDGDCHIRLMNSENKQFCAVEKTDFCSYGERKES